MSITFQLIDHNSPAWRDAVDLREQVLRKPLGSVFQPWELEEEAKHMHVAGYLHEKLVATAVLVPLGTEMKMQRVAVLQDQRNNAYGSQMMDFCEQIALENNCTKLFCHARDSAVHFYEKNGWTSEGDYFDEDGIPHLKMGKVISH